LTSGSLVIDSPVSGQLVDVGAALELAISLEGGTAPRVDLPVRWTDADGNEIAATLTDGDGRATVTRAAEAIPAGEQTLTASVSDTCGDTLTADVSICRQGGYTQDQLDVDTWHFEGSARWDTEADLLELTDLGRYLTGTAFNTSATVNGSNVEIGFSFYMSGGSGADGISLTALDSVRMTSFMAAPGCRLGYGGGISGCYAGTTPLPGWTIEVDNHYNGFDPTTANHVAFSFDGDQGPPAAWAALPDMEAGAWHVMDVVVDAPRVTVTIDGVIYIDQDISGVYDFPAYVGFTAATGALDHRHLIDSLKVVELLCPED
jgi:hypothetical protein